MGGIAMQDRRGAIGNQMSQHGSNTPIDRVRTSRPSLRANG
jgi:hypothetical protein